MERNLTKNANVGKHGETKSVVVLYISGFTSNTLRGTEIHLY